MALFLWICVQLDENDSSFIAGEQGLIPPLATQPWLSHLIKIHIPLTQAYYYSVCSP